MYKYLRNIKVYGCPHFAHRGQIMKKHVCA
nr:MAG TPA: resolvase [Caudoviricetes sp.]